MVCYAYGYQEGARYFETGLHDIFQGLDCVDVYIDHILYGSSGDTEEELLATTTAMCVPCWIGYGRRS